MSRPAAQTICFDLDGTLCTNTFGDYEAAQPFPWAIERLNDLAAAGHKIVVFTARGTATGLDWDAVTRGQLERWGAHYDELLFGKPNAAVFVDDRAVHTDAWRAGDAFTLPGMLAPVEGDADADSPEVLPAPIPSTLTTVVESGRTFAGEPLRLDAHAARLLERAGGAGLRALPGARAVATAARAALATAAEPSDADVVYTLTLTDRVGAAHLDTLATQQPSALHVSVRRLGQAAAGLAPLLAGAAAHAIAAITAPATADAAPGWPLQIADDGSVGDGLGGRLVLAIDGALVLEAAAGPAPVAVDWLRELANAAGIAVVERPLDARELDGADELLLAGTPFCLLSVALLDGRPLPGAPGPVATRLLAAWSAAAGVDLAAQTAALAAEAGLDPATQHAHRVTAAAERARAAAARAAAADLARAAAPAPRLAAVPDPAPTSPAR